MIEITLLGTGSPMVDAKRAGPSTLVRAGGLYAELYALQQRAYS